MSDKRISAPSVQAFTIFVVLQPYISGHCDFYRLVVEIALLFERATGFLCGSHTLEQEKCTMQRVHFRGSIIKLIFIQTSLVAQTVKASAYNAGDLRLVPGSGRSPGEGCATCSSSLCLEESHRWRSLVGYNPWGRNESDTTERLHFTVFI